MKCFSAGIVNGVIDRKYGKFGGQFYRDIPTYSLPVKITDYPAGTKTFALVMQDRDAIPVCGFSWLHWSIANLSRDFLEENEGIRAADFIQGINSRVSRLLPDRFTEEEATGYGGCRPPDAPHLYEIKVFALDAKLELNKGFYVNELYREMTGHVLDTASISGIYYHEVSFFQC